MNILHSFEVCVRNTPREPIGLRVTRPQPSDRELQITAIHEGGSIDEWNKKEKARTASERAKDVRVGDFISTVNVVYGDGRRLVE